MDKIDMSESCKRRTQWGCNSCCTCGACEGCRCDTEPLIRAALCLTELMANHQAINWSDLIGRNYLHRIGAVAAIGGDASSRCVWLRHKAKLFKLYKYAAHGRW